MVCLKTWYPCQGNRPLKRNISVYAKDSRSSRRLPIRPKWACTLAYRTVPLNFNKNSKDHPKKGLTYIKPKQVI